MYWKGHERGASEADQECARAPGGVRAGRAHRGGPVGRGSIRADGGEARQGRAAGAARDHLRAERRQRARPTEFTTLLEEPTGRAAALTNLGNLAVLDGKVDVGLENYTQAAQLDTSDGGILLDLGLAYKMAGKDDEANAAFTRALNKTGGEERAAYLLGVRTDEGDTSKGKVTKLSNEEIKAMLAKARTRVPEASNTSTGKE